MGQDDRSKLMLWMFAVCIEDGSPSQVFDEPIASIDLVAYALLHGYDVRLTNWYGRPPWKHEERESLC